MAENILNVTKKKNLHKFRAVLSKLLQNPVVAAEIIDLQGLQVD